MRFVRRTVWEAMTPEQMVERYAAGASMNDLGTLVGIATDRVRKILVDHGATIRRSGPRPGAPIYKWHRGNET